MLYQMESGLETRRTRFSRMTLRNFKGHKSLDLDLGRITALIGPTGSGKSTALQALLMLKATLEKNSVTGGDAYDYGGFRDIVTDGDVARHIRIGVEGKKITSKDGAPEIASAFTYGAEFGEHGWAERVYATVEMGRHSDTADAYETRLVHTYDRKGGVDVITGAGVSSEHRQRADGGFAPRVDPYPNVHPEAGAFASSFANGEYFRTLLDGVWHVPFSRVVTSYALPLRYDASIMSADRAKGVSSLLSWLSTDPSLQDKISSLLEDIGLRRIVTRNIPTTSTKSRQGSLAVDFVGNRQPSAVVHEGSGSNQLIMLLAVLAGSPRGSVITIEEPEIHLDPETQSRLVGAMLRMSVEEDKQIIFTSHSSHLLYPLLGYVKKEGFPITNSDVVINYFDTDETGAVAGVERLAINERGQVDGGLRGFWNANMKALDDLLG